MVVLFVLFPTRIQLLRRSPEVFRLQYIFIINTDNLKKMDQMQVRLGKLEFYFVKFKRYEYEDEKVPPKWASCHYFLNNILKI